MCFWKEKRQDNKLVWVLPMFIVLRKDITGKFRVEGLYVTQIIFLEVRRGIVEMTKGSDNLLQSISLNCRALITAVRHAYFHFHL